MDRKVISNNCRNDYIRQIYSLYSHCRLLLLLIAAVWGVGLLQCLLQVPTHRTHQVRRTAVSCDTPLITDTSISNLASDTADTLTAGLTAFTSLWARKRERKMTRQYSHCLTPILFYKTNSRVMSWRKGTRSVLWLLEKWSLIIICYRRRV